MKHHVRVLIIGGGAMGVSALYHLAKLGWSDIALVEMNELTAGSTWHAAGLCTHFAHNLTIQAMRAHSVRLYSGELEAETGSPVSFHNSGALRITRSPERMAEFRHVQGIGKFSGYDFNILTPDELKAIYPLCRTDGLLGAIHEPNDGHVDPSQATHAMATGARMHGGRIHRQMRVTAIDRQPDGNWHIQTSGDDFVAEHIVMAAGTWAYEIGRMAGLELPVVPILHQYLVTDRIEAVAEHDTELPIIRDPEESWYIRQERDGMIIGPYERDGKPWSIDQVPSEFGMELLPPDLDSIEHIVAAATERVPCLAEAGIKTVVNGPITFTPDANPLIGPAFGLTNCWLLTGSSMGIMEGGGAGKFLAEWMISGEPPMDALAVDPRRFGAFADRDYRIDKAIECFGNQFAIHFPFEEREAGRPRLTSSLHSAMDKAGASFGQAYGWERPNWFASRDESRKAELSFGRTNWFDAVARECDAVANRVAVADMSVFSKFEITGKDAAAYMDRLGANSPPARDDRIGLIHSLTPGGGICSEFTVTRLSNNHFYLTSAAAARRIDTQLLTGHADAFDDVAVTDVTEQRGVISIMGPSSQKVLAQLTDTDLSAAAFPWLSAADVKLAGCDVLALRVSYVGECGWEIHADMADLPAIYQAILSEGRTHDIGHFGAFAANSMRLEKGYPAWGLDLTTERTPIESGLDRFVKTSGREFLGCAQVLKRSPELILRLLEIGSGNVDPFGLHPVMQNDQACGLVTSAAFGHRTAMQLAFAYIRPSALDENKELTVEICGTSFPVTVLHQPPYDPDNTLLKTDP